MAVGSAIGVQAAGLGILRIAYGVSCGLGHRLLIWDSFGKELLTLSVRDRGSAFSSSAGPTRLPIVMRSVA
jgi:hypothetical protein